ncbi:MAG: LON peptidase substrate-binding domain-containing protein [Myxococcota bacterium]
MARPAASTLPIFPLPQVVLFPKVSVPLHIFEPRYRQLARFALEGDRRIGMVTVRPEHLESLAGDPPVYSVGCEGVIDQAVELPDGRYNIILEGLTVFEIHDEIPRADDRLFRSVHAVSRPEPVDEKDLARIRAHRPEIIELLIDLVRRISADRADAIDRERFEAIEDEIFVNAISQAVEFPVPDKQSLLEANGVSERCDQLLALLRFRLAEHRAGGPPGGGLIQ